MSPIPNLQPGTAGAQMSNACNATLSQLGYQVEVNGVFDESTENAVKNSRQTTNRGWNSWTQTGRQVGSALA